MPEYTCNFCEVNFISPACRGFQKFCGIKCKKSFTKKTNSEQITIDFVKSIINYNSETGLFTWKQSDGGHGKRKVGEVIGYLHHEGYLHTEIRGKLYQLHRLAWFYTHGTFPDKAIDHINGIKSDNRICNLRIAEHGQNRANSLPNKNTFSKLKGVSYNRRCVTKPFHAQISISGKCKSLGYYSTAEEAHEKYKQVAKDIFKEFYKE